MVIDSDHSFPLYSTWRPIGLTCWVRPYPFTGPPPGADPENFFVGTKNVDTRDDLCPGLQKLEVRGYFNRIMFLSHPFLSLSFTFTPFLFFSFPLLSSCFPPIHFPPLFFSLLSYSVRRFLPCRVVWGQRKTTSSRITGGSPQTALYSFVFSTRYDKQEQFWALLIMPADSRISENEYKRAVGSSQARTTLERSSRGFSDATKLLNILLTFG